MPYIPQKESISCLEIFLYSSTQLQFSQVQEFPQLTTLYISQENDPWRSAYFGPFIIAPKLKTLCIQLPNQAWSIDYGLPRESFRTLCVLEVVGTDRKGGPPNSVTSVRTLPLLHTLRISQPAPMSLQDIQCPRLQYFQLTPPFLDIENTYGTITEAINTFPSIVKVTIYHDQFCSKTPIAQLFSSSIDPTGRITDFCGSKGVAVLFEPPVLPSSHRHDQLLRLLKDRPSPFYIRYEFHRYESSSSVSWSARCEADNEFSDWRSGYRSREDAQNAATERMIEVLLFKWRALEEAEEDPCYGMMYDPNWGWW